MLELVLLGVQSIATLLNNPKIGGSNLRTSEAAELLGLLGMLIAEGDDAYDDLKEFTDQVKEMVDRNRGPTPTEWANLRARQQAAHDRLQAVKEELTLEEDDEDPADEDEPDMNPTVEADPTPATETLPDDEPVVDPNAQ